MMASAFHAMLGIFAGQGLLSLSIQRHYKIAWPGRATRQDVALWDKASMRLMGAACLALTIATALTESPQIGAFFWCAYFMVSGFLVALLHGYAASKVPFVTFSAVTLFVLANIAVVMPALVSG